MRNSSIWLGFLAMVGLGCPVEHGLGETATEGGTGSTTGSGSDTDAPGSMSSLSQTSSVPSTSGDPSGGQETGSANATDGESGSAETTGALSCDGMGTIVRWAEGGDPVPGIDATQRVALFGTCTVSSVEQVLEGEPPARYHVLLDCRLDGFIDGDEVTSMAVQPTLDLWTAFPLPLEADDGVILRLAAEQWGMGWNRWFIVTTDGGAARLLLEAMNADRLHPQAGSSSPLIDEIGALLGDDGWESGVTYASEAGSCAIDDPCDAEPRAIVAETGLESATIQPGDSTMLSVGEFFPPVLVHVSSARVYPLDGCDDVPVAWYDLATISEEP